MTGWQDGGCKTQWRFSSLLLPLPSLPSPSHTRHPREFRRKLSPGHPTKAAEFLRRWKSLSQAAQRATYFTAWRFRVIAWLRRRLSFRLLRRENARNWGRGRREDMHVRADAEFSFRPFELITLDAIKCDRVFGFFFMMSINPKSEPSSSINFRYSNNTYNSIFLCYNKIFICLL